MKKYIFVIIPLLLISCDWRPILILNRDVKIYEDVNVCGIENPIENINWLNDIHNKYDSIVYHTKNRFYQEISVYVVEITGDTIIVDEGILYRTYILDKCEAYNCDGALYDFEALELSASSPDNEIAPISVTSESQCSNSSFSNQVMKDPPHQDYTCERVKLHCKFVKKIATYYCK